MNLKNKKRVTIKDLAKYTGFSIATVSRVINNKGVFYSKNTYDTIIKAAKELNYYPDAIARGLKIQRTFNIAFLVPKTSEFYSEIFLGIQDEAGESDYSVALYSSKSDIMQEKRNIDVIMSNRIDAIIIATALLGRNHIEKVLFSGIPIVTIEKFLESSEVPSITIKNREISRYTVEYLIKLGHKRIAFISESLNIGKTQKRLNGYKEALVEHNIPFDESLLFIDKNFDEEIYDNCYESLHNIFSHKIDFTAVFASTDVIAIAGVKALLDLGFKVPDDISIIGFDGLEVTKYINPSITTIIQPAYEMGRQAMKLLLKTMNHEKVRDIELKAKLEIRQSTKALP